MDNFDPIKPEVWHESAFGLVGQKNFLITCGDLESGRFNTMTGGWGMMGVLWSVPVIEVAVRPTRYTYEFMEKYGNFTVSFFSLEKRDVLTYCGSHSGRDVDKIRECGLHPIRCPSVTSPGFAEAEVVCGCKVISKSRFAPDQFLDKSIQQNYPQKDYHVRYIGEVAGVWKRK